MNKRFTAKIILFSLLMNFCLPVFSEDNKKQEENEIPQSLEDLHRFEIITLGAMPFVTLDVTLGYSMIDYTKERFIDGNPNAVFPNPFKSSSNGGYNDDEIKGIILTSLGICVGIGISDLIVNIVKRNRVNKKRIRQSKIDITPIEEDPSAVKIELNNENDYQAENDEDEVIFLDDIDNHDDVSNTKTLDNIDAINES